MADYATLLARHDQLQEVVDKVHERIVNIVAGGVIPMPDSLRAVALRECVESLGAQLEPFISYEPSGA
jgi:hypothetical protein